MSDKNHQQVQGDTAYVQRVLLNLREHYLNETQPLVDGEPLLRTVNGKLGLLLLYRLYRQVMAEGYGLEEPPA